MLNYLPRSTSLHPAVTRRDLAKSLQYKLPKRGLRVGLLGGSFNPAHKGHVKISHDALKALDLDQLWWLVSPQNPLKSTQEMAAIEDRMKTASALVKDPRIIVSDLERLLDRAVTSAVLQMLKNLFPQVHFVWIMGADNLHQIDRWQHWGDIFKTIPIAVIDRPGYTFKALSSKAANKYAPYRMADQQANLLPETPAPAWVFLHKSKMPISATAIRRKNKNGGK